MIACPTPPNESDRLKALHSLNILDTSLDLRFELAVSFVVRELKVPMALITLIDSDRQWFKATYGVEAKEIPRNISICAHAICEIKSSSPSKRIYEVSDLKNDLRFFKNPLVTDEPYSRAYISYTLQSADRSNIGTLCLVDTQTRVFSAWEKQLLIDVGGMVNKMVINYQVIPL